MKILAHELPRSATAALLSILGLASSALGQDAPPPIPETPAPVREIVSIQTFELAVPAPHEWRVEKPAMRTGYVLVLKVDPALVYPRQLAEPVLYVGGQTAERVNVGFESGHVVAIVPATIDPAHPDYLDLAKEPIWFGTPELPERVDARRIARERKAADEAGIAPFAPAKLRAARRTGGALNRQESKRALLHDSMRRLVIKYSPQERALVESVVALEPDTPR